MKVASRVRVLKAALEQLQDAFPETVRVLIVVMQPRETDPTQCEIVTMHNLHPETDPSLEECFRICAGAEEQS